MSPKFRISKKISHSSESVNYEGRGILKKSIAHLQRILFLFQAIYFKDPLKSTEKEI